MGQMTTEELRLLLGASRVSSEVKNFVGWALGKQQEPLHPLRTKRIVELLDEIRAFEETAEGERTNDAGKEMNQRLFDDLSDQLNERNAFDLDGDICDEEGLVISSVVKPVGSKRRDMLRGQIRIGAAGMTLLSLENWSQLLPGKYMIELEVTE